MSLPKLGTKSVKGMILHHATTRLGWTWEEASESFDEWFGACSAHRERVESTLSHEPAERCPKCGGPGGKHDPACVVHPMDQKPRGEQESDR